jgi:predicted porin
MSRRESAASCGSLVRLICAWCALAIVAVTIGAVPARAQQKTGPGIMGDESLTWEGITFYGVVDLGIQYDTHMAPFTPYRPAASGNIVRQNSSQSVVGVTPSNMGQSRVGFQGNERLSDEWSATFQIESFFNPQSGAIADSLKSLTANNGKALANQSVGVDGSSAGQAFQTAWVGLKSTHFGTLTFGRQATLFYEGAVKYDPNQNASAFGLLGASNTFSGAGSQENNRLDQAAKYAVIIDDFVHLAALYKFSGSNGSANTAFQAQLGAEYAGASVDAYYSKVNSAITATALNAAQVAQLPVLGYSVSNSLAATISDNTAYAVMAFYKLAPVPLKIFAGYEHIKFSDPNTPLNPGYVNIGGYVLAFTINNAYVNDKILNLYWTGVRYSIMPALDLTAAYYDYSQNAYGSGKKAGCSTAAASVCSGDLQAVSLAADYRFNLHFDIYAGAMYSGVHNGLASGYLNTTNINPTVGARYKF